MNNTSENIQTSLCTNIVDGLFTSASSWIWPSVVPLEAQVPRIYEDKDEIPDRLTSQTPYCLTCRFDLRKYCFTNRIVNVWNSLPDNVILVHNVNQFKNRLDKHWKMHDIVFNYRADFAETGGLA